MTKLLHCACAAFLMAGATSPCLAADSPWNGTWKENLAKSKLSGDTMTYTAKPNGMFHLSAGGIIEYDFACDGKTYPTLADRTMVCTGSPAAGYDVTTMAKGTVLSKSHRTFSPDGTMMFIKGTSMHPDGSTSAYEETYKRETGTTGMAGKWLDVKVKDQVPTVETWSLAGDTLSIRNAAQKSTITAKLDGSQGTVTGPNIPPGASVSVKAEGANKVRFVDKLNGKVLNEGTWALSADGKTLTGEDWVPGKESEKETIVFEKQ